MVVSKIEATLGEVRRKLAKGGKPNEQNTKASLVEPVLRALGWDTEDPDEVDQEYSISEVRCEVDYALRRGPKPSLLIEAKQLGTDLDDHKILKQIMIYARAAGVQWIILTDGNEYRIYNQRADGGADQMLFRKMSVKDGTPLLAETLGLFSKETVQLNAAQWIWIEEQTNHKVRTALEAMLSGRGDPALAARISERTGLNLNLVKQSLQRCKAQFSFAPPIVQSADRGVRVGGTSSQGKDGRSSRKPDDAVKQLLATGRLRAPVELTKAYKGQKLAARIETDGSVTLGGHSHASINRAAQAAMMSIAGEGAKGKRPAVDAWMFWEYKAPDGTRKKLDDAWRSFVNATPGTSASHSPTVS